jgi:hypothetical protein
MAQFPTKLGNDVLHCHVPNYPCASKEFTQAERNERRELLAAEFPGLEEDRAPSRKYNCHGYSYTRAHGWFNDPSLFIDDDYHEVPIDEARRSDVLVYEDDDGEITHTAIVKKATDGEIETVRSKWGQWSAVIHEPDVHPPEYGGPARLLRKN